MVRPRSSRLSDTIRSGIDWIVVGTMGVPSEISLPTKKPDIRPNLGEGVRWSQIRLDQPLDQEGRKEIRLDQPSCRRLRRDSMLL